MKSQKGTPSNVAIPQSNAKRSELYLSEYGEYLVPCGVRRMGRPGEGDDHALHGELPLAKFDSTGVGYIDGVITVTGQKVFGRAKSGNYHYMVDVETRLGVESTVIETLVRVTNLHKTSPLENMMLMHVNFDLEPGAELLWSAPLTKEAVTMRAIPPELASGTKPALLEWMKQAEENPRILSRVSPNPIYDPEGVFYLQFKVDANGMAHSMQVLKDGFAHYISHNPTEFPIGVVWIRTSEGTKEFPVDRALGLVLPATAGAEGYTIEKAKGLVREIPVGKHLEKKIRHGLLAPSEVAKMKRTIEAILAN
jgi:hypothetical protein